MAAKQHGQFQQFWMADLGGTLRELSKYIQECDYDITYMDTDLSTLNNGGTPVTANHRRGALDALITVKLLLDPGMTNILRLQIANRNGCLWRGVEGANSVPGQGDDCFQMTGCCVGYPIKYDPGQKATVDIKIYPADSGSVAPQWIPY